MAENKKTTKKAEPKAEEPKEDKASKLEATVQEQAKQIEQLTQLVRSTADKGRLMNYDQAQDAGKKPTHKISLSRYDGNIIVGWKVNKDRLVFHPTSGEPVGEEQEIEVVLRTPQGETKKHSFGSYKAFSDARYADRIECNVIGKTTDYAGNTTFTIQLPSGEELQLAEQFVN